MAERLRTVEVSLTVDTNKRTYSKSFTLAEDETVDELVDRMKAVLETVLEGIA